MIRSRTAARAGPPTRPSRIPPRRPMRGRARASRSGRWRSFDRAAAALPRVPAERSESRDPEENRSFPRRLVFASAALGPGSAAHRGPCSVRDRSVIGRAALRPGQAAMVVPARIGVVLSVPSRSVARLQVPPRRIRELTTAAIDCDVHPQVPNLKALFPHLEPYWRDSFQERGIPGFESNAYPPNAPLSARPEWKDKSGNAATDVTTLAAQVFDRFKAQTAICNCLYGVELIF